MVQIKRHIEVQNTSKANFIVWPSGHPECEEQQATPMRRAVRSSGCSLIYQSEAIHQKPLISYFYETPSGSLAAENLEVQSS